VKDTIDYKKLIEDVETVQTDAENEAAALANTPVTSETPPSVEPEVDDGQQALDILTNIENLLRELVDLQSNEDEFDSEDLVIPEEDALPEEPPKNEPAEEFTKIRNDV
jgi:hypothetical protein